MCPVRVKPLLWAADRNSCFVSSRRRGLVDVLRVLAFGSAQNAKSALGLDMLLETVGEEPGAVLVLHDNAAGTCRPEVASPFSHG